MKTNTLILLMFFMASIASSKIGAQVILKNGDYFGFAGNYEYKDDKGGLYEIFVWGSEGEFESEVTYKSKTTSYKISCNNTYSDGDNYLLFFSFNKVISGTFPQESEFKKLKESTGKPAKMFAVALRGADLVKENLLTVIENFDISGFKNNEASDLVFKQLESAGDEGPP